MKVAVLGASGRTGAEVVRAAVKNNINVIALVRDVEKFKQQLTFDIPSAVTVRAEKVDIYDHKTLEPHLKDVDALISCLGPTSFRSFWGSTMMTESMTQIITAMQNTAVRRIVACSTWASEYRPDNPKFIEWFLKPVFIGSICRDHRRAELLLEDAGKSFDLNYTVVRPPGLKDTPLSSNVIKESVGAMWVPECERGMPRSNVASYMLGCVLNQSTFKKDIAIGLAKQVIGN